VIVKLKVENICCWKSASGGRYPPTGGQARLCRLFTRLELIVILVYYDWFASKGGFWPFIEQFQNILISSQ